MGSNLRNLHQSQPPATNNSTAAYHAGSKNRISDIQYENNRVYINDTQYFDAVPPNVWNFSTTSHQPAQQWLYCRKGLELSPDNVLQFQKLLITLIETIQLVNEIDKVITA